jgi:tRNA pseudouridine synthase 10
MSILQIAERAMNYELCDHCFGRLFAKLSTGLSNEKRGYAIRSALRLKAENKLNLSDDERLIDNILSMDLNTKLIEAQTSQLESCWLCHNIFHEVDKFVDIIIDELIAYEFDTFIIGTQIDPELVEREEALWTEVQTTFAEPLKSELNREIGKRVGARLGSNKRVDFTEPDIVAIFNTMYDVVELQIAPLFIYGRYRKLLRGLPQTRWDCNRCRGKGCTKCNMTGKIYETSIEEILGNALLEVTGGTKHAFHGMGREDIDARMLGQGRPFVVEISKPRIRKFDLALFEENINKSECAVGKVEFRNLRWSTRAEIRRIKFAKPPKTYRVDVRFDTPVAYEKLNELHSILVNTPIMQRTPQRVKHRRADKIRSRRVFKFEVWEQVENNKATFIITGECGIYIKELIHGDHGRTTPSVAELLGVNCEVEKLDVIDIHDS